MYVLCSRGGSLGDADPDGCLLEVSRLALPVFMARCDGVLRAYAEDQVRALMAAGGQSAARCGGRPLGWESSRAGAPARRVAVGTVAHLVTRPPHPPPLASRAAHRAWGAAAWTRCCASWRCWRP